MENNLIKIQEMLIKEMERLDNDTIDSMEIARGNTLSQNATTYIKTINVGLRVIEMSNKFDMSKEKLHKELGIEHEK